LYDDDENHVGHGPGFSGDLLAKVRDFEPHQKRAEIEELYRKAVKIMRDPIKGQKIRLDLLCEEERYDEAAVLRDEFAGENNAFRELVDGI
jgi:hypothetical protein